VCLANSRKPPSGRCIAGREFNDGRFGGWIRPVSARPGREIAEEERRYVDGTDPRVLDVVTIQFLRGEAEHHQRENHLIDDTFYWERRGAVGWSDLESAIEDPAGPLWMNGYSSSHGQNDQVPEHMLPRIDWSLILIRPNRLEIVVRREQNPYGSRRRVRARFEVAGHEYLVAVTDPIIERQYLAQGDGTERLRDGLLCVSLGEVFHGFAYKLAAAVIMP
jgi:hypothetical protein